MDSTQVIAWNQAIDTAIKIGLVPLISGFLLIYNENKKREYEKIKNQQQRYEEEIIKPFMKFMDEMITVMSKAYWDKIDKKEEKNINRYIENFREREGIAESRLEVINNPQITKEYKKLDDIYYEFMKIEIHKGLSGKARELLNQAKIIQGTILKIIYPNPNNESNKSIKKILFYKQL
ncbi:MAG: hypothetical protein AB4372_32590 [Xenococcus sp. (in: cyanobacteria)]